MTKRSPKAASLRVAKTADALLKAERPRALVLFGGDGKLIRISWRDVRALAESFLAQKSKAKSIAKNGSVNHWREGKQ